MVSSNHLDDLSVRGRWLVQPLLYPGLIIDVHKPYKPFKGPREQSSVHGLGLLRHRAVSRLCEHRGGGEEGEGLRFRGLGSLGFRA